MAIDGLKLCERLLLFECMQCGKCTGGCPVSIRTNLNPRALLYQALLGEKFQPKNRTDIWECTTCGTCIERCPKGVRPMDAVVSLRADVVESGRIFPTVQKALESIYKHGNPWERIRDKRTDWVGDLKPRILTKGERTELLLFVGCTPAYDPRIQELARGLVQIFQKVGVDFAILGNEESCCANEVKRLGEQGLFELMIENNRELFRQYEFKTLVTISPHCYNTFINEYGELDFEILHYTQVLSQLLEAEQLKLKANFAQTVTYHDPCFLGKQNKIFDEPRQILTHLAGDEFIEMARSRERSLCCEGGGGRMWLESASEQERLADVRVKEAVAMNVDILATACPFCLLTLEDAVKTSGHEGHIEIKDLIELVVEQLDMDSHQG